MASLPNFLWGGEKKGYVYEKLINNLVNDHTILEYRACVLFGEISLVYIKHRPIEERFLVPCTAVKTVKPEAVFTAEEIEKCIAFLRSIGLEYGELDILRDNTDGRLYIIDSNNTPYGPPQILSRSEQQAALEIVGAGVQQTLSKLAVDATHQLNRFSRLRTKADPSGRTTLAALSLRRILGRLRRASLYYLDR